MSTVKRQPFCISLNVLTSTFLTHLWWQLCKQWTQKHVLEYSAACGGTYNGFTKHSLVWCKVVYFSSQSSHNRHSIACPQSRGRNVFFCECKLRNDSRLVPSQWETALLCNDVPYWLGTNLESALQAYNVLPQSHLWCMQYHVILDRVITPDCTGEKGTFPFVQDRLILNMGIPLYW